MAIDKRLERIARRLSTFELVRDAAAEIDVEPGARSDRGAVRFLGFYSRLGVERALRAYGIHAALQERGLVPYQVELSSKSAYHSRLEVLLDGAQDDDHRLIDLVAHLRRARSSEIGRSEGEGRVVDVLLIEWLCLQNPRRAFSAERPRLPGQRHPGLGLGYSIHNVILLMARRLGREAVLNVPEHWHLSLRYRRAGYRFVSEEHRIAVEEAERGLAHLRLPAAAWAAERGLVRRVDPDQAPWVYPPHEMVVPMSRSVEQLVAPHEGLLRRLRRARRRRPVTVDLDELRRSLEEDPVEGLDPRRILVEED